MQPLPSPSPLDLSNLSQTLFGCSLEECMNNPEETLATFSNTMHQLAICWNTIGRPAKALNVEKKVIATLKMFLNKDHHLFATARNNEAIFLRALGQYRKAQKQLDKARNIVEKYLSQEPKDKFRLLNNLGCNLRSLGRCHEAAQTHEQASLLLKDSDTVDRARALSNAANAMYGLGQYAKAFEMHQQALDICSKSNMQDEQILATSSNNSGLCLAALGKNEEALISIKRARVSWTALYGPSSLQVATALNNIGSILSTLERFDEALDACQQAKAIRAVLLGEGHPLTLLSTSCVEACQRAKSKKEEIEASSTQTSPAIVDIEQYHTLAKYAYDYLLQLPKESLTMAKNPTGFIRIHLPVPESWSGKLEALRLNYWAPGIPIETVEAAHNHPRYFESLIIKGGYRHRLFRETSKSDLALHYRSHRMIKGTDSERNIFCMGGLYIQDMGEVDVQEPSIVSFPKTLIHQVTSAKTGTLTLNCVFNGNESISSFDVFLPVKDSAEPLVERESVIGEDSNRILQEILTILRDYVN